MIPKFNKDGNLPPGTYNATLDEIEERYGYTIHRRKLLQGLKLGIRDIEESGCTIIYLDGSFITNKPKPGDYDVCYHSHRIDFSKLEELHPVFFDFDDECKSQKEKYLGEFWPSTYYTDGFHTILDGFKMDIYTRKKKGIIEINI